MSRKLLECLCGFAPLRLFDGIFYWGTDINISPLEVLAFGSNSLSRGVAPGYFILATLWQLIIFVASLRESDLSFIADVY
jgi:hypothetical protein